MHTQDNVFLVKENLERLAKQMFPPPQQMSDLFLLRKITT